nr:hypothetical protein [Vibrio cholerae]
MGQSDRMASKRLGQLAKINAVSIPGSLSRAVPNLSTTSNL